MALPKIATQTFTLELPQSKKKLECRPYLVKEDKILLIAAQASSLTEISRATREVINSCVLTDGFDVANVPSIDADFLLVNLRARSVGETVNVEITCSNKTENKICGNVFEVPLKIIDLKIEDEFADKRQEKIMINKDVGVIMKPTIFKATLENDPDGNDMDNNISIIYNSIEQIFDKEEISTSKDFTKEEFVEWIEQLPSGVFTKMIEYINNLPVLVLAKKAKCPKCNFEHELKFNDPISFF